MRPLAEYPNGEIGPIPLVPVELEDGTKIECLACEIVKDEVNNDTIPLVVNLTEVPYASNVRFLTPTPPGTGNVSANGHDVHVGYVTL